MSWSEPTLARFLDPRFLGTLQDPHGEAQGGAPDRAVFVRFQVQLEGGRVKDVRFHTFQCVTAVACSSLVAERSLGKTLAEVRQITVGSLLEELGPIPPTRRVWVPVILETLIRAVEAGS